MPRHSREPAADGPVRWSPFDDWESPWCLEDCSAGDVFARPAPSEKASHGHKTRAPKGRVQAARPLTGEVLEFEAADEFLTPAPPSSPPQRPFPAREPVVKKKPVVVTEKAAPEPDPAPAPEFPQAPQTRKTKEELFKPVPVTPPLETEAGTHRAQRARLRAGRARPAASWGTLFSLGLGALGLLLLSWIYWHDAPAKSDEDLRVELPADQTPVIHSHVKLRTFLDSVPPVEDLRLRSLPPWDWDTPSLSEHLRAGGTALDNLRDLLEDEDWHPLHSAWCHTDHSAHAAWPHVIFLIQAQSAYLARRGNEMEAFTAALDLAEMSRRVMEMWSWPAYARVAQDLGLGAAQSLAVLLKDTRLDAPTLAAFQEQYTACRPETAIMRQYCAAFYTHQKKTLIGARSGEPLDTLPGGIQQPRHARVFFKVNETLALFANLCRDARDEISRPAYAARTDTGLVMDEPRRPLFYHPNSAGAAWFEDRAALLRQMPPRHHLAQCRHGLVLSLFALRRHLAEKKRPPESLEALVPEWLAQKLTDPFTGNAFGYDAARGLLYSAGADLRADGGRPGLPPLADDLEPTVETGIQSARRPPD